MGWITHHAIVVTSYSEKEIKAAHKEAVKLKMAATPIVASPMNGYLSFLIAPDGSKEGWADSTEGDVRREKYREWLDGTCYGDLSGPLAWVEVQYGDDGLDTRVVADSDAKRRKGG